MLSLEISMNSLEKEGGAAGREKDKEEAQGLAMVGPEHLLTEWVVDGWMSKIFTKQRI